MKTKHIIAILISLVVMGFMAVNISQFAKEGELKVHLRAELMQVRKDAYLLPFKPDRRLGDICRSQAKSMAQTGVVERTLKDQELQGRLRAAQCAAEPFFMEIGLMPANKTYLKASQDLLAAARDPKLTIAGFGQVQTEDHHTYYCYLLAGLPKPL